MKGFKAILSHISTSTLSQIAKLRKSRESAPLLPVHKRSKSYSAFDSRYPAQCLYPVSQPFDKAKLVWKFAWPEKDDGVRTSLFFCVTLLVMERSLYVGIPYLYGLLLQEDAVRLWQLALVFLCEYMKSHVVKPLRPLLWLNVAQKAKSKTMLYIFSILLVRSNEDWTDGQFLSEFNKGSSLDICFEEAVFSVVPTGFDLITTMLYLYRLIGWYTLCVGALGSMFIGATYYDVCRTLEPRKSRVRLKRTRDSVAKTLLSKMTGKDSALDPTQVTPKFTTATEDYQQSEYLVEHSRVVRDILLQLVFYLTFFAFAASQILLGQLSNSQIIVMMTFMHQLEESLKELEESLGNIQNGYVNTVPLFERVGIIEKNEEKCHGLLTGPADLTPGIALPVE